MAFSGYNLFIRQQPVAARACGSADRPDRRPIDPVVILQLSHRNTTELYADGETATFFCVTTLIDTPDRASSHEQAHSSHDPAPVSTNLLTGTILSSIFYLKDPATDNQTGAFFVFSDLNIRPEGSYRLRFDVFGLRDSRVSPVAHCLSAFFTVYSAKRFPGMTNSTELSKTFSDQGLKIRIRKDIRVRKKARLDRPLADAVRAGGSPSPSKRVAEAATPMPLATVAEETWPKKDLGPRGSCHSHSLLESQEPMARDPNQAPPQHEPDHDHFRVRHPYNSDYDQYYRTSLQTNPQRFPAPLLSSSSSEKEHESSLYRRMNMKPSGNMNSYAYGLGPARQPVETRPAAPRSPANPLRFSQEIRPLWKTPILPQPCPLGQREKGLLRSLDHYDQPKVPSSDRLPSFGEAFAAYDHQVPLQASVQPSLTGSYAIQSSQVPRFPLQSARGKEDNKRAF
ncbi:Putative uncharacterized protein [Taphrina deformans PYCC 5710]|uniref:Velvet domain-containing protein n=1 Tax=Taphrina deformans (strain PYCC 5710 / ATCC 11124 / CBS 356.35 / IMI 108563 / JCM 9778 / NBRC 8474) TaxID=1097556 RepID=R4XAB5_TAPDE|nr:Putative uncharacterized protein [Taphrina deformans PYCC 5710]|eukprot:CCG82748.1 Putative uncharacterized protein [Taphrina deformans PYCC 5710]